MEDRNNATGRGHGHGWLWFLAGIFALVGVAFVLRGRHERRNDPEYLFDSAEKLLERISA